MATDPSLDADRDAAEKVIEEAFDSEVQRTLRHVERFEKLGLSGTLPFAGAAVALTILGRADDLAGLVAGLVVLFAVTGLVGVSVQALRASQEFGGVSSLAAKGLDTWLEKFDEPGARRERLVTLIQGVREQEEIANGAQERWRRLSRVYTLFIALGIYGPALAFAGEIASGLG